MPVHAVLRRILSALFSASFSCRIYVFCILFSLLFPSFAGAASEEEEIKKRKWWNRDWPYRRRISLHSKRKGYAVVRFNTFGRCAPDGGDICVIVDDMHYLRQRVLVDFGRDDMAAVAFPVADPGRRYSIYFGNRKGKAGSPPGGYRIDDLADPRDAALLPKAGLFLEVRELGEGAAGDGGEMKKLIASSGKVLGRQVRRYCSLGMNPFSASGDYLTVWTGFLRIERSGEWSFATNSNGPSFVRVDGREVVSWPGWHSSRGGSRAEHRGKVFLSRGLHRFCYYYASKGGRNGMVCGIREPPESLPSGGKVQKDTDSGSGLKKSGKSAGAVEKRFTPVGPSHVQPLLRHSVGALEDVYSLDRVDFTWKTVADMGLYGRDVCAVRFQDRTRIRDQKLVSWKWRFGDGQKGRGGTVEHVYLQAGRYVIEVEMKTAGGTVIRNRSTLVITPSGRRRLSIKDAVTQTGGFELPALSEHSLRNLLYLRWQDGRDDLTLFLDAAWVFFMNMKPDLKSGPLVRYADALLDRCFLKDHAKVVRFGRYCVSMTNRRPLETKAGCMTGETLWHIMGKPEQAEKLWEQLLGKGADGIDPDDATLSLLLSDLYDAVDKSAEAEALFKKVQHELDVESRKGQRIHGEYSYRILYFTGKKQYERAWRVLNTWIREAPWIIKTGDASFYRAGILKGAGYKKSALSELERVIDKAGEVRRRAALVNAAAIASELGLKEKEKAFKERLASGMSHNISR